MFVPMVLSDRSRAFLVAKGATVVSVLGGVVGYAIGSLFFEALGQPILDLYGYAEKFTRFADRYNERGAWTLFFAGLTPVPYKVITIPRGVTGPDVLVFMAASLVSGGVRSSARQDRRRVGE